MKDQLKTFNVHFKDSQGEHRIVAATYDNHIEAIEGVKQYLAEKGYKSLSPVLCVIPK